MLLWFLSIREWQENKFQWNWIQNFNFRAKILFICSFGFLYATINIYGSLFVYFRKNQISCSVLLVFFLFLKITLEYQNISTGFSRLLEENDSLKPEDIFLEVDGSKKELNKIQNKYTSSYIIEHEEGGGILLYNVEDNVLLDGNWVDTYLMSSH